MFTSVHSKVLSLTNGFGRSRSIKNKHACKVLYDGAGSSQEITRHTNCHRWWISGAMIRVTPLVSNWTHEREGSWDCQGNASPYTAAANEGVMGISSISRPRYRPPWAGSSGVRPTQGNPWVGRVSGLYGPLFAGRPMGPQGPIKGYHVTIKTPKLAS
jgi:hypothetical protein